MEEYKYCAYIDVLGYGNLVKDSNVTVSKKIKMLHSIYSNLATQFLFVINEINKLNDDKIYVRSFSDCFYLDCSLLEPLLIAIKGIYENAFGFYSNFTADEEQTPLLRCGIVKDWLIKFRDIGAIINNTSELNPVGLAVARAYEVSEKSKLSGMRIIISPEVIKDLNVLHITIPEFKCYCKDIKAYNILIRHYFKHITINEANETIDLYELLWPFDRVNDYAPECIDIFKKIKGAFPEKFFRHFRQTVKLFIDSYQLSEWKIKSVEIFQRDKNKLQDLIKEAR